MSAPDKGWKHFLVHGVLNLPERDQSASAAPAPAPAAASQWERAGQAVATKPDTVPWQIEKDKSGARFLRKFLKGLLAVAIIFFAYVGVKEAVRGDQPVPVADLPAAISFDQAGAAGVGERFATSFLTWDENTDEAHAEAVGLDYFAGPNQLGWNGKGKQSVREAVAAGVEVNEDGTTARVLVLVDVVGYESTGDATNPWSASTSEWMTLEVPVAQDEQRTIVTGAPAFVGTPSSTFEPSPERRQEDTTLSTETKDAAEVFFAAYGEGDVEAITAPGSTVAAPTVTDWTVEVISDWTVFTGEGDDRQARAAVTWTTGTGMSVTQNYDLTITRVTGATGERWQISAVHGG